MSNVDFTTSANPEILATEVACLKATLTLILGSIGQGRRRESYHQHGTFYRPD